MVIFLNFQAIYLAKRNIRKKGMLELHEQVKTMTVFICTSLELL